MQLFDTYLEWLEDTESPRLFHRWTLISGIGTLLGRNAVLLPDTQLETYANQYIVLVGPPACRKNASINVMKKLLKKSGIDHFASDRTTKEKFILDLQTGFNLDSDNEALNLLDLGLDEGVEVQICAPELQDFLGAGNLDFISFLTHLWDMPEDYNYRIKAMKTNNKIRKPTVNLLGGATPTNISSIFPDQVGGQGFLSRTLMIFGGGQRQKIAWPTPPDAEIEEALVESFKIIRHACRGVCKINDKARQMLTEIYNSDIRLPDARLESYMGRRHTSLLKLCMITAAADLSFDNGISITEEHVEYANTMLSFTEGFMGRALGDFGASSNSADREAVLKLVEKGGEVGVKPKQVVESLSATFDSVHSILRVVEELRAAGKIYLTVSGNFVAMMEGPVKGVHCNFELLLEGKDYYEKLSQEKTTKENQSKV